MRATAGAVEFWSGNMAAAHAVLRARVQVIAAYPITPQTHTVEYLAQFVADGDLDARLCRVESEHSALSACAGASSVGARAFTASCSQGIALMSEVLYFTSGMRFPVVMAVANRTLSAPVNIWTDHQDTLVNRDSGWLQLYACTVQEVYDLLLCAFKIAEDEAVMLPCMVCYDGFVLSHAAEPVRQITQQEADAFLPPLFPPCRPRRPILDPAAPLQFGEVLLPEWYPDYEYKKHRALADSTQVIERVFGQYSAHVDRPLGLVDAWRCDDAELVLVGLGSMMRTAQATAKKMRERGEKVGVLTVRSFRPFPEREVVLALACCETVVVLDRDIGYGTSGMVYPDVIRTLYHGDARPTALNFIIGTGGKDISPTTIERCLELARLRAPGSTQTVYWPDARGPEEGLPYSQASVLPGGDAP